MVLFNKNGGLMHHLMALVRIQLDIPIVECGLNGIPSVEVYKRPISGKPEAGLPSGPPRPMVTRHAIWFHP